MSARNLLFAAVCLGGAAALAASLSPVHAPQAAPPVELIAPSSVEPVLAELNASFRRGWEAQGIAPATRAADLVIARRLALGLMGTVPSVAEIRAFEAARSAEPVRWWLQRILADRRSSDYLAERFARAVVGTEDGPFLIYRRRRFVSWLADELHANRPFDQIVRQLIAADGLWTDQPATNFLTVTSRPDEKKGPDPNRLAARVSRAFLGVRLDCAECHDHPFRAWKQDDFQSLASFFSQTQQTLRGIRDSDEPGEIYDAQTGEARQVAPRVPFAADLLAADGTPRKRLAAWVTHPQNRAFARVTANRVWALLFGRPLVEPIDDIPPDGQVPEPLQLLADDFSAHEFDLRRLIALVALSDAFQLDSARTSGFDGAVSSSAEDWSQFPLTQLRPEQMVGSLLQAASLATIDYESHILVRFGRAIGQGEFIKHYGDSGEDEFSPQVSTIPQRLLLMNGKLVKERTKESLLANAATQIAVLASSDEKAVEVAYLACLSRAPTVREREHFVARLAETRGQERRTRMEDIYWALMNATEFSWNH